MTRTEESSKMAYLLFEFNTTSRTTKVHSLYACYGSRCRRKKDRCRDQRCSVADSSAPTHPSSKKSEVGYLYSWTACGGERSPRNRRREPAPYEWSTKPAG